MTKWEKEVMQSLLDSEGDAIAELEAQYKRALKDINEKVKGFQADIDLLDQAMNQEGLDDNAKALLKSQKQSKIYQKQYQEALQGQVSGILDKMQADNYSTIEGYLKTCYEDSYVGTMYDLAQQGIPVITPINQASAVQAILTDSKVSNGLYSALGVDVAKLKKSITQEISRGIASGLLYSDISRNISNVSGAPLSRAKTITRTEGHRIQNTASRNAALEAKAHGADLVKLWDATLDGKTRPSHRKVDGEIRELDEKFSNGLDRPGDPDGSAAEVINCRCQEFHKPRWDAEGAFLKRDNFTGEVLTFNSPKDYADFKEKYWSKENLDYMQKTAELETKYGTKKYDKLLDKMSDREYEQFKKLEDASPMWKAMATDSNPIKWPKNGQPISAEQYKEIMSYARNRNIEMSGFKRFDGDPKTVFDIIDDADSIAQLYPKVSDGKRKLTIKLDQHLSSVDFAETNGRVISINANAYRDITKLQEEYQKLVDDKWFVKGTDYHSIIKHEMGHVVANAYNIDVLSVAKKASGISGSAELFDYCEEQLSEYSSKFSDGSEIISECFASVYGSKNNNIFALKFVEICAMLIS